MTNHSASDQKATTFFDDLWQQGDYWQLETSNFERAKYARQQELIGDRRYGRVLEIGCGAGVFTRSLASLADQVLAVDVSPAAIARAQAGAADLPQVDFRVANIMRFDAHAEGPWDLVVLSETIYYLGWLYSFFEVCWLVRQLFEATSRDGRLMMTNTYGGPTGQLLRPWIIETYRSLMLNVEYALEREEHFEGTKEGVRLDVLISLFRKQRDRARSP